MKQSTAGRVAAGWSLFTVLAIVIGILWLQPDVMPDRADAVLFKLVVLLTALGLIYLIFVSTIARRWSLQARRLQEFVDGPLDADRELRDDGPPELEALSRAIKSSAERIRQVIERANLELSRRETLLAAMAEGVLAVDQNLKVVFCNDAFAQAFGTRTPVGEGRTLYEVVREPALREILRLALHSGTAEKDRFQLPSAAGRWFEARALPLGNVPRLGAVVVLHDITDSRHQEQVRKDFVAD